MNLTTRRLIGLSMVAVCAGCAPGDSGAPSRAAKSSLTGPTVSGDGAQYAYDGAGNLTRIAAVADAHVSIADFSPRSGGAGELVTVYGAGFSPSAAENGVQLGGTVADVVSATATELVFAVPAGSSSGRIVVTRGTSSATTAQDFTVVTDVIVAGFTPRMGPVGTVLTITGNNFSPTASADSVAVGAGTAVVGAASLTALTATVGSSATSGKVSVTSPAGSGVSADDFFLLPGTFTVADVESTSRVEVGGTATVTITQQGQAGLVLFDAVQGQNLTLYASANTFRGLSKITIYAPGRDPFWSQQISGLDAKFVLPPIPASGTYTIAFEPASSSAGSVALQVLPEATGVLQLGTAATLALARGQNGRVTFNGAAGASLGFACPSASITPPGNSVFIGFWQPDGVYIAGGSITSPESWQLPQLQQSGTYTMTIQPSTTAAATVQLLISQPDTGIVLVDGPPVQFQNAVAGQAGRFSFVADAGDVLGIGVTAVTTAPLNNVVSFTVRKPDGSTFSPMSAGGPNSGVLPALPVSGTYTLVVQPPGTALVSTTFLVTRAVTGPLARDGTPTVFRATRVGQRGRYTFSGAAGERFTIQATGSGLGAYGRYVSVTVNPPAGSGVAAQVSPSAPDAKLDLGALAASGTYGVAVDPNGATTGELSLRLVAGATEVLVVDDPPRALALGAAQNGWYTFAASAGDVLGLGVASVVTSPVGSGVALYVRGPDGTLLANSSVSYPTSLELPRLPTTGVYALAVNPMATGPASFVPLLSRPITGALPIDGTPVVFETARAGQAGRFTFSGTAGQRFTLRATGGPVTGTLYVRVYRPDGAALNAGPVTSGVDTTIYLGALPTSGVYAVAIAPQAAATGRVTLRLVADAIDALAIDGPERRLDLGAAQRGRYGFDAVAGDRLGLAITTLATVPAAGLVRFEVLGPDGASIWSNTRPDGGSFQLPALPATGAYTLVVSPSGASAATFGVLLSRALNGSIATDGTVTTYQTARPGQAGRYVFEATAGQRFTMQATLSGGFPSYGAALSVSTPTGTSIGFSQFATADTKVDLAALPATGTYVVTLAPGTLNTGSIALRVVPYSTDGLIPGDPAKAIALGIAQDGWLTFTGTAGASLNLVVGSLSTTPGGGGTAFTLVAQDGRTLSAAGAYGATTWQLPQLPSTGTYGIHVAPIGPVSATGNVQLVMR